MLSVLLASIASPAWSQSRVYTNADLDRPLNINRTPTADEMQGILARQFVPASKQTEPTATILPFDPEWPFTYSRRLDPDPWRTPGWQPYVWPFYNGYGFSPYAVRFPHASAGQCHGAACGAVVTHHEQGNRARSRQ
jgi:hypothetical protein